MKKFIIANLQKAPKDKDLIFIGNPRLKPEAQLLVKLLKEKNRDFFALYLKIPVSEVYRRTNSRARLKSEDQGVQNRINYHKIQVSKTVKYFQTLRKLKLINANVPIKNVAATIQKVINDYSRS